MGESVSRKTSMKRYAHSREMFMALLGDQKWGSQMAVDTYERQSSLKGGVNGAAGGSRGGKLVGFVHIRKAKLT